MNAIQYAEKLAEGIVENDADLLDYPVHVGDEEIVKAELERRGLKVSMKPSYLDAARTQIARYLLTVTRV